MRLKMGRIAYWPKHIVITVLASVGIAPQGTVDVHEMLFKTADYLTKGGDTGIFSPVNMILCRKPPPAASDLGLLVRTYALFLEERLECFRVLKYDVEVECLPKPAEIQQKVLKESFKIYCAIKDGTINLINKFFEMPRHEAITAFDIYKHKVIFFT
ncbi:hypothetical protein K1719_002790 [Acacia pycnantha]|nr:hypothetical protein K1719_002790 [Acacia pycnantha]